MPKIADSRAAVRAGERLLTVGGKLRAAWNTLGLGWSFDDLMEYLKPGLDTMSIPREDHGKVLGMVSTAVILAIEQDRDKGDREPVSQGDEFVEEKRESGVVGPYGGDRIWGSLRGQRYCVLISHDVIGREKRWHISVSNEAHLAKGHEVPVWRDFVSIVHQLRPGVSFVIGIPPQNMWMNKNPNVLHALETRDAHLIAEWRRNADAVRGTEAAVPS